MKIMLRCLLVGLLLPMGMLQGCRTPDQPTPAEQPDEKPDDSRSHIGLENVRSRLRSLCGG